VGVGEAVMVGVGQGVAARAAIAGSPCGEYHRMTSSIPAAKAVRDPKATQGKRRCHRLLTFGCRDLREGGLDDADGLMRDWAHSRAASARSFLGSTASARSAYARLARGSSLNHASQSSAARLAGSRVKTSRNARRASALSPSCAAASPLLSSVALR
jgi:hypothetical protein